MSCILIRGKFKLFLSENAKTVLPGCTSQNVFTEHMSSESFHKQKTEDIFGNMKTHKTLTNNSVKSFGN